MNLSRDFIAREFIQGHGIEIGALHNPLSVPKTAHVTYVDRVTITELRKYYPELDSASFVNVDIIDNGEKLTSIQDFTQDFVIANHFLEHCENPIGAVFNMLRVLRVGGILYLAVPDKRYDFDIDRPVTSLEHCFKDYQEGPEWSRRMHFEEWARWVDKLQGEEEISKRVTFLMEINYSIHFHVWTQREILELIVFMKSNLDFKMECELFLNNKSNFEVITVLRKSA